MKYAVINSSDFFGPENPGHRLDAKFGIFLATFLNDDMDVSARVEALYRYLQQDKWTAVKKAQFDSILDQPTIKLAVEKMCKYFGIGCSPRIEKNLRESVKKLGDMRKEELRREVIKLQEQIGRVLRMEKPDWD